MSGRIITVRHGKPALSRGVLLSAQGYGDWWEKYDESGLLPGQTAPSRLTELARGASGIFSSSMPRAYETAVAIAPEDRLVKPDPLFVEAPLPSPPWPSWMKLSPRLWGVISRVYWLNGFVESGMETREAAWRRVDTIISTLGSYASDGDVVLCAHGYLNWMISRRMPAHGWQCEDHRGGNKYWSWRLYTKAG